MPRRRNKHTLPEVTADEVAIVERLLAASGSGALVVGGPVRCPDCTGWGLAGDWDATTGRFAYECPSCAVSWPLSHQAVAAALSGTVVEPDEAPTPWAAAAEVDEPAPVVRVRWAGDPATSGTAWARRPAR